MPNDLPTVYVTLPNDDNYPTAVVREDDDGNLVLDDPAALAMIQAIDKHNCRATFDANKDRIDHFKNRIRELGRHASDTVIVVINVDALYGKELAEALMPGYDWQAIRDRGEVPFARGLADRNFLENIVADIDIELGRRFKDKREYFCVVVVDHGVVQVYSTSGIEV